MSRICARRMQESQSPLVVQSLTDHQSLADLIAGCPSKWSDSLLEHGALLFRGFAVHDVTTFDVSPIPNANTMIGASAMRGIELTAVIKG